MPIDASIPLGVKPVNIAMSDPTEQYAKGLQLKDMLTRQQMAQQSMADEAAQRAAFQQSGGDTNAYLKELAKNGNYKAYSAALEQQGKLAHVGAQTNQANASAAKSNSDVLNQTIMRYRDQLSNVTDPQSAAQWVQEGFKDPVLGPVIGKTYAQNNKTIDDALKMIPTDPVLFNNWKQQAALGATKFMELNKPTYQTRNTGATTDTLALPGLGGKPSIVSSIRNTATPGEVMADARSRQNTQVMLSKPFEVTGEDGKPVLVQQDKQGNIKPVQGYGAKPGKAPTEFQGKSATFGARAEEADKILSGLESEGKYSRLGALSGGGSGIGSTVLNPVLSKDTQKAVQAQRDFVNAVLRQESGAAISQGEFDNARKQYFPQPGDSKEVLEQKSNNRKLAIKGFMNSAGPAAYHADEQSQSGVPGINISDIDAEIARRRGK